MTADQARTRQDGDSGERAGWAHEERVRATPPAGGRVDLLRGCAYCQAAPSDWCEHDCGSPAPIVHPDYRQEPSR